ncbi:unnamed protein product, partial [Didymodactylos carnosus]
MNEDDCIIINQEEDYTTCPALQPLNQRTPVRSRALAHPRTPLRKSTTSLRDDRMPEIRRKVLLLQEIPPHIPNKRHCNEAPIRQSPPRDAVSTSTTTPVHVAVLAPDTASSITVQTVEIDPPPEWMLPAKQKRRYIKTQHFNRDDQLQQNHPPPQRTKPSLRKQKHRFQTGTSSNFDSYTNISNYVPPNQQAPPLQNYCPQVRRRRLPTPPRVSSRAPSRNQQSIPPATKRRTTTLNARQLHNIPALMTLNLTHVTPSHTCHEHTKGKYVKKSYAQVLFNLDQRAHLPLPTSINRFDN